ncbi:hypothetical protein F5144DRAFT_605661 [Chaetomium tenue]|uniref:Uncharacterized protein n=1 Tax=Chaetomium tenue TaxID=1854479 RepID=A0ACB7NXH6_9PEZI|nr:hypothetical protein F5144DRAFT_605661 [Chaetomium globosum]
MSTAQGPAPQASASQGSAPQPSSMTEGPLGTFDILNVPSRVTTPPRWLPLVSFRLEKPELLIDEVFGKELEDKALEVASRLNLPNSIAWVQITSRASRFDPLDSLPTLLIVMDNWDETSPRPWQDLVEEMKRYIDGRVANTPAAGSLDISVEVISKDLVLTKYFSPLDDDDMYPRILAAWPEIKAEIRDILESSPATADCMTSIALLKLGFDKLFDNPKTVYITLSYDSSEAGWPPVLAKIQSLLDGYGFDLHAHLEHSFPGSLANFQLLRDTEPITKAEITLKMDDFNMGFPVDLETEVNAGADIGAHTYVPKDKRPPAGGHELSNPIVGTLGCWLQIKVQGHDWQTVGLTNYHVVRPCLPGFRLIETSKGTAVGSPEKTSKLFKADRDGLRTAGTKQRIPVESPTRTKLNFNVRANRFHVEEEIREQALAQESDPARITDMEAQEQKWRAFFDSQKHILGNVCLASGFMQRTTRPKPGRLDWALIRPTEESRVGQNLLPTMTDWLNGPYQFHRPRYRGNIITSPSQGSRSLHTMQKGEHVYKVGASTKFTIGEFERLKPDCIIREERHLKGAGVPIRSDEFMFFGTEGMPFARRGDSGSVVWDTNGHAVGLLFRGHSPNQTKDWYAYVTPIEDVFASIKAQSGGKIQEIRFLGES